MLASEQKTASKLLGIDCKIICEAEIQLPIFSFVFHEKGIGPLVSVGAKKGNFQVSIPSVWQGAVALNHVVMGIALQVDNYGAGRLKTTSFVQPK